MIFTHFKRLLKYIIETAMIIVFFISMSIFVVIWTGLVLSFLLTLIILFIVSVPYDYLRKQFNKL